MAKVAVVGGGIFGVTAAVHAARAGHTVELFEEKADLLMAASGTNQYRIHRGYHYPRSASTAESASLAEQSFREEYPGAIIEGGRHLYGIAREGSKVTTTEFMDFCDRLSLPYNKVSVPDLVNEEYVEAVLEVPEARFDPDLLRAEAKRRLLDVGVQVRLSTRATREIVESFDQIIIAAYAGTNAVLDEFGLPTDQYQYEVCEKPVVTLPSAFGQTDLVIMDGPFMCVDPLGKSGNYVLGNVVHAIHATNTGVTPYVPEQLRAVLDAGLIRKPEVTNFKLFVESGEKYIPILKDAVHVGSLFTIRTVLPNLDATDSRPTLVTSVDDRYIRIFSGKIGNCVLAAREAVALI